NRVTAAKRNSQQGVSGCRRRRPARKTEAAAQTAAWRSRAVWTWVAVGAVVCALPFAPRLLSFAQRSFMGSAATRLVLTRLTEDDGLAIDQTLARGGEFVIYSSD